MAQTASTGFRYRKSLNGEKNPSTIKVRINDSQTLVIGDAVRVNTSGVLTRTGTTGTVLGVLVGIEDELGMNPFAQGYLNATGATITGDDTVVTASDNSSRAHYLVGRVIADTNALFYNDSDGSLAQTNLLQLFDNAAAASNQISQGSASDTSGQFQLIQLDPDGDADVSKGLFRIAETQLLTYHGNSTAVIAS